MALPNQALLSAVSAVRALGGAHAGLAGRWGRSLGHMPLTVARNIAIHIRIVNQIISCTLPVTAIFRILSPYITPTARKVRDVAVAHDAYYGSEDFDAAR